MKELLGICVRENKRFTDELFLELAQKYLREDISYFFQKHMINGVAIDLRAFDLIPGFSFETRNEIPQLLATPESKQTYLQLK
jgi:hypothetical protein